MISYSIDSTIFIPPVLPEKILENKEQTNQIKNDIINYRTTINRCHDLIINQNSISVYLFKGTKHNFDYDYIKASRFCGLPMDTTRRKVNKILTMNFLPNEYHYGDKIESDKYFFDNWFSVKDIDKSNCILTSSLNELIIQDNELESRLIRIGILNHYIYRNPDFHFLILNNNNSSVSIESNIKYFKVLDINHTNQLLKTQVQTKQIDDIIVKTDKFETVRDAYEEAKKNLPIILFLAMMLIKVLKQ